MKAKGKQKKKRQESDTEDEDDEVPIRTPDYEEFHFPCNKWLDSKEEDGEIERTLKCKKKQLHYEGGVNQGKFLYIIVYTYMSIYFDKLKDKNHFLWYISKIQYTYINYILYHFSFFYLYSMIYIPVTPYLYLHFMYLISL